MFKNILSKFNSDAETTAITSKYVENKTFSIIAKISQIIHKTNLYSDVINENIHIENLEKINNEFEKWYTGECYDKFKNTKSYNALKNLISDFNINLLEISDNARNGYNKSNIDLIANKFYRLEDISTNIFKIYNQMIDKLKD
ncbi:hypothetical protein [Campylobacter pinnipediorum]|uniref:hypothetical protein n=2 Tax=Campylobacter pinnipediorum TaxID=1965231 RepID=UPI00112FB98A|nr:hypothetical protein [Campylobacter pinnipediorum]